MATYQGSNPTTLLSPNSPRGESALRRVEIRPDITGQYVARTVFDEQGRVLVRQGTLLTPTLIGLLLKHEIPGIWATNTAVPNLEVREAVAHETRETTRRALKDVIMAVQDDPKSVGPKGAALLRAVKQLVDDILSNEEVVLNISHLRAWDNYTYEHSVQVAILSAIMGRHLFMSESELHRLTIGAILHDIGKVAVPQEILSKSGALTDEEFEIVKGHVRIGWDLVHDRFSIPPTSSIVVLQHHERLDGSGYPKGLKDEAIYPFSKIVAVADVFDAMRADRVYRSRLTPVDVVEIFLKEAGTKFEKRAVEALFLRVAVVPTGEIVRLSHGHLAIVTGQNPGHPLTPLVTVVADDMNQPVERHEMDLKDSGWRVEEILNEWPPELARRLGTPS